ncbi:protein kinase [Nocardiopsis sp. EMB25]|uniref:serine/threonine-protein kinase n=1 Tax=Nocardiopsis sp. EMB25 TaxID=2835867 RepID=UPI002283D448|nr:serine/threonine protein kinase [Nocardiopsis sp. EMB25]MCY9787736.1 protein kinase [Nocardiopsis sp. EMB25]
MSSDGRSSVGRYELRERLGAGGMGTVWRAWDPALQRDVAVKEVLLPEGMDPDARAEAHARSMREAQATARINSTAVVAVHDVLDDGESPWIVMELLSGASLQQHLDAHGPMTVTRVEEVARSVLDGLRAAHAAGVTHRDIKPANIMLTADGRTVLTDFGIANVDGSTALTQTGVYIGSPEYMAPERFEGERALPASDLWSLGVTLYSLLEGRTPFKRDSITGIISAVLTAPLPPRLSTPGSGDRSASAPLHALVSALLSRDASARPTPAEALALLDREKEAREARAAEPGARTPGPHTPAGGPQAPVSGPQTPPSGPQAPVPGPTGGQSAWAHSGPHRPPGPPGPHTPHHGVPGHQPPVPNPPGPSTGRLPVQPPTGPQRAHQGPNGPQPVTPLSGGESTGATTRFGPGSVPAGHTARLAGQPPRAGAQPSVGTGQHVWNGNRADPPKPAAVITAAVMLGLNALYLMVLTALFAGEAVGGSEEYTWGTVSLVGVWGLFSAFAGVGLMARSRVLYGAVVIVQAVVSVLLILTMFSVLIYTPDLLVWYALILMFNLVIGGLLLIPPRARAFFGFGPDAV